LLSNDLNVCCQGGERERARPSLRESNRFDGVQVQGCRYGRRRAGGGAPLADQPVPCGCVTTAAARMARVRWDPFNPGRFAVSSADDIRVCDVAGDPVEHRRGELSFHVVSRERCFERNAIGPPTCMAWAPDEMVASGLASGKVVLLDMSAKVVPGRNDTVSRHRIVKQFVPKYSRRCNAVEFNPRNRAQFVCALEKVRNAYCGLLFDVNQLGGVMGLDDLSQDDHWLDRSHDGAGSVCTIHEPVTKFSNSEAITCATWLTALPECLAVGAGQKWVRLYDLRTPVEPVHAIGTHSKVVQGLALSPFSEYMLASYSEDGAVNIWDFRTSRRRPLIMSMSMSPAIQELQWSQTKSSTVAMSFRCDKSVCIRMNRLSNRLFLSGRNEIQIHDIASKVRAVAAGESSTTWKALPTLKISYLSPVVSFDLHPADPNRFLVMTSDGRLFSKVARDTPALDLSCTDQLGYAQDAQFGVLDVVPKVQRALSDIASVIRERAKAHYALDCSHNACMFASGQAFANRRLHRLWSWMSHALSRPDGQSMSVMDCVAKSVAVGSKANPAPSPFANVSYFENPFRLKACEMLGWCSVHDGAAVDRTVSSWEARSEFEVAATIAVFHLDLKRALLALRRGFAKPGHAEMSFVCLALSGYEGGTGHSLWAETAATISGQIKHPYLRAAFAFLCGERSTSGLSSIVHDEDVSFADRLSFACRFLGDDDLNNFVSHELRRQSDCGNLDGVLLFGLLPDCVPLLRTYLDKTGDIQTVALIGSLIVAKSGKEIGMSSASHDRFYSEMTAAKSWIEMYRDMLDRWRLWNYRALFDIARITIVINHWRSAICPLLRLVSDLAVPRPSRPQVLLFHDFVFKAVRPARRRCPVARSA
ncbi:hypothetical protein PBRA_000961, partial [Plasmodiophora brassicae]